jgi:hypothetical protein
MVDPHNFHHHANTGNQWRSRAKIALYVFLGIIAFFLKLELLES